MHQGVLVYFLAASIFLLSSASSYNNKMAFGLQAGRPLTPRTVESFSDCRKTSLLPWNRLVVPEPKLCKRPLFHKTLSGLKDTSCKVDSITALMSSFSEVKGARQQMEDIAISAIIVGNFGKAAYFAVFDGHNGKKAAIWAKNHLETNLAEELSSTQNVPEAFRRAFQRTDHDFLATAERDNFHDGCTATVALVLGEEIFVANAGDSRAIICRGGSSVLLSSDHKPDRPSERARILQRGGTVALDQYGVARINGLLATSRGFGDWAHKHTGALSAEPEVQRRTVTRGDDFLLLATDGLWDVMASDAAAAVLADAAARVQGVKVMPARLTEEALRRGTTDNVAALVVDLRGLWQASNDVGRGTYTLARPA